jgi:dTDP-4-amino-4,6-dideoxygalactose transaminase
MKKTDSYNHTFKKVFYFHCEQQREINTWWVFFFFFKEKKIEEEEVCTNLAHIIIHTEVKSELLYKSDQKSGRKNNNRLPEKSLIGYKFIRR